MYSGIQTWYHESCPACVSLLVAVVLPVCTQKQNLMKTYINIMHTKLPTLLQAAVGNVRLHVWIHGVILLAYILCIEPLPPGENKDLLILFYLILPYSRGHTRMFGYKHTPPFWPQIALGAPLSVISAPP